MDNILRSIGLEDKIPAFNRLNITTDTIDNIMNSDLPNDALSMIQNEAGVTIV